MKKVKIPRNAICPCGSNLKYKKCCMNKDFDWYIDENGKCIRQIALKDELAIEGLKKVIEIQNERFKKIYGRDMADDEPIFFDTYVESMDDMFENMLKSLEERKYDPAFIYAARKTRRLVFANNESRLTTKELQEWDEAYNEYYKGIKYKGLEDEVVDEMITELKNQIYLYGMIINKYGSTENNLCKYRKISIKEYIFFCITKTMKTLKSVVKQAKNNYVEDCYSLLRSIFENYLHIIYLKKYPEKLQDLTEAKVGISRGTHEYAKTKKGKENKRIIIDKVTGKEFDGAISSYNMICASDFEEDEVLFDYLYKHLSNFTHPNVLTAHNYINKENFDPTLNNSPNAVLYLGIFLGIIILDQIDNFQSIDILVKKDIENFISRMKIMLNNMGDGICKNSFDESILENLNKRISYL